MDMPFPEAVPDDIREVVQASTDLLPETMKAIDPVQLAIDDPEGLRTIWNAAMSGLSMYTENLAVINGPHLHLRRCDQPGKHDKHENDDGTRCMGLG